MKKTLIGGGLAAPILILFLLFIVACNPSRQGQDTDIVQPDGDTVLQDDITAPETETVIPDDADDIGLVENDIEDDTPAPDADTDNIDCPPLSTAPFPYYKDDGTIHFCRKCDTPTAKDPQCVQNLWKEANLKLTTDHPEADCYPYPCEMSNLKPMTKEEVEAVYTTYSMHECDLMLGEYGWVNDDTGGQIKHWNLSGGKAGFVMYKVDIDITQYITKRKFFVYDTASQKYAAISPGDYGFAYQNEKALVYLRDSRSLDLATTYMYVGYFNTDGTYRVVFNKPIYSILDSPAINEKWVFANINFMKNGASTMYYAKVGEWKWTALGTGVAYHPHLYGDLLSISDEAFNGYVCDLSKDPTSLEGCVKVNRGTEKVSEIQFDRSGAKRFAYTSDYDRAVVVVTYEGFFENMVYTDLITDFTPESASQPWALYVERLDGDILLYREITMDDNVTLSGGRACFYRLDTKQKHCMKKMENDKQYGDWVVFPYGHSEYEGKWFLYQKQNNSPLILRDMTCYCEKEGVCPFEGMK